MSHVWMDDDWVPVADVVDELRRARRALAAIGAVCDAAEHQASRWEDPLPIPEWVARVRRAALKEDRDG